MVFPVVIAHMAMVFTSGPLPPRPEAPHPAMVANNVPEALVPNHLQQSGISGTVYRSSGNHMPAPNHRTSPPAGIRATVCIFELTSGSQTTPLQNDPRYYQAVHTRLIRQVETDPKGFFQVQVPPGTYSVFTKKGNLFYASRRDEKNNIAPVEVLPGKITRVQCSVESDHKAVY